MRLPSSYRRRRADIGAADALGLLLLVAGVVVALQAHQQMAEMETAFGQAVRMFSESQQERYESLQTRRIAGAVGAVVGLVLVIVDS